MLNKNIKYSTFQIPISNKDFCHSLDIHWGRQQSSLTDRNTLIDCQQMKFIFQHSPIKVHMFLPAV